MNGKKLFPYALIVAVINTMDAPAYPVASVTNKNYFKQMGGGVIKPGNPPLQRRNFPAVNGYA
jgi:hypothetical protein